MSRRHHVVLIPGFFGFANLGELRYFVGVEEVLESCFRDLDLEVEVHEVVTLPTASIRYRAARVLEVIEEVTSQDRGPVHLVGHSTGGLDARLAVAPTASLPTEYEPRDAFERVQSLVTVATPHYGTPLANFYGGAMGRPLLRLLAVASIYVLRRGRLPLSAAIKLAGLLTRADDLVGLDATVADQVYDQLLADFSEERRQAVMKFLDDVSADQSLVFQLTPAGLDLFNTTTAHPSGIAYGSVVTRSKPPRAMSVLAHAHDVYAQSMHLVYSGLWNICARSREADLPTLTEPQRSALASGYGRVPDRGDNDGVVPTLSQVWGPVLHTVEGDHLDVVGHFGQDRLVDGVHADWLPTLTGFDDDEFERTWTDIGRFLAEAARQSEGPQNKMGPEPKKT